MATTECPKFRMKKGALLIQNVKFYINYLPLLPMEVPFLME